MPRLVRLYITHVLIGFVLAVIFTGLLIWLDVAHLRHLILSTPSGGLAAAMLIVFNGIVFAGVQFGIAVMRLSHPDDPPHRGRPIRERAISGQVIPSKVAETGR